MQVLAESGRIVDKFGGTSVASAERYRNVARIVRGDANRQVVVVSAPGSNPDMDNQNFRVTQRLKAGEFGPVWNRFRVVARDLFGDQSISYNTINVAVAETERQVQSTGPFAESRGEYLSGRIAAELLEAQFVDPTHLIKLNSDGSIHPDTYGLIPQLLGKDGLYVVPGYYGANVDTGEVQLLPPGGSDLTGAILARGIGASLYENWTDVNGVLAADPRIVAVEDPEVIRGIEELTYNEMGELAYRGVGVLQVDAVEPATAARVPINIRNSKNPRHPGTMVVEQRISPPGEKIIGLASREGYVSFRVARPGMDKQKGVIATVANIFSAHDVALEQGPGERDSVSFICHSDQLGGGAEQAIMSDIYRAVEPTSLTLSDSIGLVSLVGQRVSHDATIINADLYPALRDANIVTWSHIQAIQPNSIVFSVADREVIRTMNTVYRAFF
jgi:aspartate kinase